MGLGVIIIHSFGQSINIGYLLCARNSAGHGDVSKADISLFSCRARF